MKLYLLAALLLTIISAAVIPFDNDAIEKVFQQSNDALFLFQADQEAESAALEALRAYEATNPGFVVSVSSKNDGHGFYQKLAEFLGVDLQTTPKVLFLSSKQQKFRYGENEITADNLASFIAQVRNGEIEPFLKSEPIPESNDDPVKVIVGKTFKELVLDTDKEVLVKFYAPWCGHCKTLAPHYDEAAELLASNPNIVLAKVDSTENEIAGVNIEGFPTLRFWGKDKSNPVDYNGGRDTQGIIQWLKEHTQYEWVDPVASASTDEDIDQTL